MDNHRSKCLGARVFLWVLVHMCIKYMRACGYGAWNPHIVFVDVCANASTQQFATSPKCYYRYN